MKASPQNAAKSRIPAPLLATEGGRVHATRGGPLAVVLGMLGLRAGAAPEPAHVVGNFVADGLAVGQGRHEPDNAVATIAFSGTKVPDLRG